eukprot:4603471-Pleurochrysis_carterae.AAC.5
MLVRCACLRLCGAHVGAVRMLESVQRACGSGANCRSGANSRSGAHEGAARMRVRRACECGTLAQECAAHMLVRRACLRLCGAHAGAARMRENVRRACVGVICETQACMYAWRMRVLMQGTKECVCEAERMRVRPA